MPDPENYYRLSESPIHLARFLAEQMSIDMASVIASVEFNEADPKVQRYAIQVFYLNDFWSRCASEFRQYLETIPTPAIQHPNQFKPQITEITDFIVNHLLTQWGRSQEMSDLIGGTFDRDPNERGFRIAELACLYAYKKVGDELLTGESPSESEFRDRVRHYLPMLHIATNCHENVATDAMRALRRNIHHHPSGKPYLPQSSAMKALSRAQDSPTLTYTAHLTHITKDYYLGIAEHLIKCLKASGALAK